MRRTTVRTAGEAGTRGEEASRSERVGVALASRTASGWIAAHCSGLNGFAGTLASASCAQGICMHAEGAMRANVCCFSMGGQQGADIAEEDRWHGTPQLASQTVADKDAVRRMTAQSAANTLLHLMFLS
jgi:hypothetical protein